MSSLTPLNIYLLKMEVTFLNIYMAIHVYVDVCVCVCRRRKIMANLSGLCRLSKTGTDIANPW